MKHLITGVWAVLICISPLSVYAGEPLITHLNFRNMTMQQIPDAANAMRTRMKSVSQPLTAELLSVIAPDETGVFLGKGALHGLFPANGYALYVYYPTVSPSESIATHVSATTSKTAPISNLYPQVIALKELEDTASPSEEALSRMYGNILILTKQSALSRAITTHLPELASIPGVDYIGPGANDDAIIEVRFLPGFAEESRHLVPQRLSGYPVRVIPAAQ